MCVGLSLFIGVKRTKEPTDEEKENILLVLANDGYLKVMSADTGTVLRSIFLSTIIKFRYVVVMLYVRVACVKLQFNKQWNLRAKRKKEMHTVHEDKAVR